MYDTDALAGPFYHGTKADLKPGDLITPGFRSNYGHGERTIAWVYMTAMLSGWGAELAQGEGPGRIYIVEPTGPFEDDPDLTDKRFAGNPTKSYRSRHPLRVVREVEDWEGHSPEEIQVMKDALAKTRAEQDQRIAHIPSEGALQQLLEQADSQAHAWAPDASYIGGTLLMLIRGPEVEVLTQLHYRSESLGERRTIALTRPLDVVPPWGEGEVSLSGRITDVTAWHKAWVAVMEACITEIGLALESRLWIAVDADCDKLIFRLEADGPERSWQRAMRLEDGVLSDDDYGDTWDFTR